MGSGGVAIAALPTVICLEVPFSDGLGGGNDEIMNHASCISDSVWEEKASVGHCWVSDRYNMNYKLINILREYL